MSEKKILIIAFFMMSFSLFSNSFIHGEFIYNLNLDLRNNPFPGVELKDFEGKVTEDYEEQIIRMLLEEARWVFSGMIYGFGVEYTPSDRSRSVERYYEINPTAQIPFGDTRMEVYDTYLEDNIYHLFIRYQPDVYQQRRIDYWQSGIFDSASAYGIYQLYGEDSRINSMKDAIRLALENLLKQQEYNKPSKIQAEVVLRNSPVISIDSGHNRAFVKLRVDIKNVQHYLTNN